MFHEELDYEEVSAAELQAELDAAAKQREYARAYAELAKATQEAEAAKKQRAIAETKEAKQDEKAKLAAVAALKDSLKNGGAKTAEAAKKGEEQSVWASSAPVKTAEEKLADEERKFKAIEEKLAAKKLADESKPKKETIAPPKKKEKVATKMSLLDFYDQDEDGFLEKLAKQEKLEKVERAAAAEEAARLAAEQQAAWEAEEGWQGETAVQAVGSTVNATFTKSAAASAAAPAAAPAPVSMAEWAKAGVKKSAAPKPKRKPVEIANKWGAPVALRQEEGDDEDFLDIAGPALGEALPSLADAMSMPVSKKTQPPPQPKTKAKKKWGKVDSSLLGLDADNQNMYA